tara:strand:+ start:135 stop:356 length:222 start_codon:yes stop_codon:yes gene_type:complete
MLHDLKDTAVNMTTIAITAGIGLAFLGALGVIVARESYRDVVEKGLTQKLEKLDLSKWPERVRDTLLGGEPWE